MYKSVDYNDNELTQEQENLIELAEDCGLDFTGDFDEGEPEFIGTAKQFTEFENKQYMLENLNFANKHYGVKDFMDSLPIDDMTKAYEAGEIEGCDTHPAYGRETIINIEKLEIKL